MPERSNILTLNAGSSSIRFALFGRSLDRILTGKLDLGTGDPRLSAVVRGRRVDESWPVVGASDDRDPAQRLLTWVAGQMSGQEFAAVGHRVAIGGLEHSKSANVTPAVLTRLKSLVPLAPLHQPRSLALIEAVAASYPPVQQVACFDTAFHRTMPAVATTYALPAALRKAGARRYGFHGLSYEAIARRLPQLDERAAKGRAIVCHLGSGASLCALRQGRSVATTMGFSPLSGLVMGSRPGDLDPGLMIWLLREQAMRLDELENVLYHECGVKGLSGSSADMRDLLASSEQAARDAVAIFVYSVSTEIGRLTAALGGLNAIVFTAGIGESAPEVRERVCERLDWLGVDLDDAWNRANETRISTLASPVTVWVLPTDEEGVIAEETLRMTSPEGECFP